MIAHMRRSKMMNKKLICLFLSLIMLVGVCLVGCGGNDDDVEVPSTPLTTRTLSMFVVTDKTVYKSEILDYLEKYLKGDSSLTDENKKDIENWIKSNVPEGTELADFVSEQKAITEQYEAVEEQINIITKKQFSIQLNIQYIREDVYYEHVKACIETPNSGYTGVIENSIAVKNELDVPEYIYPWIPDTQVDILFIGDKVYFNEFVEEELLSSLSVDKTLQTEIYPSYFQAVTVDGLTYGIPNNVLAGEYTYLLLNKELVDKYSFSVSDISTWEDCERFLEVVADEVDAPILLPEGLSETEYTFEEILEEFLINNHYWSVSYEETDGGFVYDVNPNKFSLLGGGYLMSATQNGTSTTKYLFDSTLSANAHQSQMASLMYYMNNDYFKNAGEDETYAVSLFRGDIIEAKKYQDDYYMVTLDVPHVDAENAYKGMFAVSSNTTEASKSLQIISCFVTNPEVRNLLQYGIEGENYVLDKNGYVVELENNLYKMDINTTGNIFNAYATDDTYTTYDEDGNIKDVWGLAKLQSSETLVHPLFRFDLNEALADENNYYVIDNESLDALNALSDEYFAKILEIDKSLSISEIRETLKNYGRELASDKILIKMKNMTYGETNPELAESDGTSVAEIYYTWLLNKGLSSVISTGTKQ